MSNNIRKNQTGMASILITMIMMIVITLIVIGFAAVTRRNQREATDRQLSTQAYDAAETGVNDAIAKLKSNPSLLSQPYTTCTGATSFIDTPPALTSKLSDPNNVSYTCLLVNGNPGDLVVPPASQGQSAVLNIAPSGPTNGLNVSWNAPTAVTAAQLNTCTYAAGVKNFKTNTNWACPYGILRIDLYQYKPGTPGSGGLGSAQAMSNYVDSLYIVPTKAGTTSSGLVFDGTSHVYIDKAGCSIAKCSINLTYNFGGQGGDAYYARLGGIYSDPQNITITSIANGITFPGSQAVIDSTGKAQDELRRIQVRVPITGEPSDIPNFGLQSTNTICKQLSVTASTYTDSCP